MLKPGKQIADLDLEGSYSERIHDHFEFINTYSIYLTDNEADKFRALPDVLSVERNGVYTAVSTTTTTTATRTDA